ncbi:diguanylate cyclase [Lysobacter sp. N42]|uniref:diguanylate cyclase n=2 Tax=Gammaproteobacteria TaxID=1236 RepID=UPI000DD06F92|nr:diguanylate cyclase [Lysobacter sp. N42]RTE85858.1 GGDEF domain-containing protein [Aliidiomarina sp. B3213]
MNTSSAAPSNLFFAVIYGSIAAFFNAFFLVNSYGELWFHFGQLFVLLCLMSRGFKPALIACLFSSVSLWLKTDNPYFIFLMFAELIVVYWFYKRGMSLVIADVIYWLIVGIPVSYGIMNSQYNYYPQDYMFLVLLKQLLNGLIYTIAASLLMVFIPLKWCDLSARNKPIKLSARIFYLAMNTTFLPALLVALVLTSKTVETYEREFASNLESTAAQLNNLSERYLRNHQNVIKQLAELLSFSDNPQLLLEATQNNFPGFITMLIADASGNITHGTPKETFQRLLDSPDPVNRNVADRDYFRVPFQWQESFVSNVFQGRGFGNDMIIAVSSPIIVDGETVGVVEGSLNLPRLEVLQESLNESVSEQYIVLADASGQVIHTSSNLPFTAEDNFNVTEQENRYTDSIKLTSIQGDEFFYEMVESSFGWKAYVFSDPDVITQVFIRNMIILLISLFLISTFFLVTVRRFAMQFTLPLKSLIEQFTNKKDYLVPADSLFLTTEVEEVGQQLQESKRVMMDFNRKLEEEVEQKTKELSELNARLAETVKRDALTGLFNRRYFDETAQVIYKSNTRNEQPLSVVGLDIDFFKKINDTYGHSKGDDCLKVIAEMLKSFFHRESDLVARYGGEEFVMILTGGSCEEHFAQIESFRKALEEKDIPIEAGSLNMTVSIGMVSLQDDFALDLDTAMRLADEALYTSKEEGRNRTTVFNK